MDNNEEITAPKAAAEHIAAGNKAHAEAEAATGSHIDPEFEAAFRADFEDDELITVPQMLNWVHRESIKREAFALEELNKTAEMLIMGSTVGGVPAFDIQVIDGHVEFIWTKFSKSHWLELLMVVSLSSMVGSTDLITDFRNRH